MTLGRRRSLYRVRNTVLDWVKLAAAAMLICFCAARLLHYL